MYGIVLPEGSMKDQKRFYDVHFHTMDLSHPNLTAFLERMELDIKGKCRLAAYLKMAFKAVKSGIRSRLFREKSFSFGNVRNLLSYMESSMEYDFHILEYFLKSRDPMVHNGVMEIAGEKYNKIVLCPLIMDFGDKTIRDKDAFYNMPPVKPVVQQTADLLNAVKHYFAYELKGDEKSFDFVRTGIPREKRLFEIYPFMGINTSRYSLHETEEILHKYFSGFSADDSAEARQAMLFAAMGQYSGDIDDRVNSLNLFAGIKVYPPLGFDPWPSDSAGLKKVRYLYEYCIEHGIPVTTHCSPGGFTVSRGWKTLTDPRRRWRCVLEHYPGLKLNFAHFGYGDRAWLKTVAEYLKNSGYNVYADISCNPGSPRYYRTLQRMIGDNELMKRRVLFGSDFMINLLDYRSYNDFLKTFSENGELSEQNIRFMAGRNAEAFLFGSR